ncbi:MAG TPA: CoA transferase [Gemmatimonadaceae bacterium]|nr:CoA transferase [Gemmatimonadaceae bacterium]
MATELRHEPLAGLRVLDLTRVLAGPLCTMMLGDLGADVIKVERPGTGDDTRGWGPPFDDRGESAYFLSTNRNKKSVALDLRAERDQRVIGELMRGADVVVDNFRPGTLEALGIGPDLDARPELIWCTIVGFGPHGRRPGYDVVVQAESGWMAITGEQGGAPMKMGVALADVVAGKDAAIAILGACVARARRGAGARLVVSLAHSAVAALVNVAQNTLVTGRDARRWGNAHANLVPYQLFETADRPIIVAVGSDAQWHACARALGLDDLAGDRALATNAGRIAQRERVIAAMTERLGQRAASEWMVRLVDAGVPAGRVRTVLEALADVDASPLTGVAPSVGGRVRFPPPRLDEHGETIRSQGWGAFASGHDAS